MTTVPQVTEGAVRISSIVPIVLHEDVEVWEIDCFTKYTEIVLIGTFDDGNSVYPQVTIDTTERSLNTNPDSRDATVITFPEHPADEPWNITAMGGGRYSFTVTLYRYPTLDTADLPDRAWLSDH